jgi:hypothetical protein
MDVAVGIAELLEAVLLELDMRTLLVSAQRVSKHWHAVIKHSPRIQQALFYTPVRLGSGGRSSEEAVPVINPLLQEKFGKFFFDIDSDYSYIHRSDAFGKLPWATSTLNPLYVDSRLGISEFPHWTSGSPQDQRSRQVFTRSNASWRKMLVSQPPPPVLGFSWLEADDGQEVLMGVADPRLHGASRAGVAGDGVRMGMLYDLVQHRVAYHERSSLWFRVTWHHPRGPFMTSVCHDACHKLAQQTHVIAEFLHRMDSVVYPPDPPDAKVFDEAFCSEDFEEVAVKTEILRVEPGRYQMPGWHFNAVFFLATR